MWPEGLRFPLLIVNIVIVVAFEDSDFAELKKKLENFTLNGMRFDFCIDSHSVLTLSA